MKKSLRFCMVTTFYPPYNFGGDGIFVRRLSNELAKRGHHVEIVHCIDAFNALSKTRTSASYQHHPGITVHALQSRLGAASPILTHLTGRPLLKKTKLLRILSQPFDVIHFHNISLVGGPAILKLGSALKLYTMHEYWLRCPTHLLYRFQQAQCLRRRCFFCSLSYRRPPQLWRWTSLMDEAVKHVDAFIAPSQFCKNKHLETYRHLPIVHLPSFAPAAKKDDEIQPADATASRTPYFLFVGRLERIKGLQTLIPIFKNYSKAKLRVAGSGAFEATLMQLARGSANIEFLGHLAHRELHWLYQHAVAVILPYPTYEVFPQVILEAFMANAPVIARGGGALTELVHESRGGFVYQTEEELVRYLDEVLADRTRRDKLGRNAAMAYQEKWTPEMHLQDYFKLISTLQEQKRQHQEAVDRDAELERA